VNVVEPLHEDAAGYFERSVPLATVLLVKRPLKYA